MSEKYRCHLRVERRGVRLKLRKDGTPDVEIVVERSRAGQRTVTSPSGHVDPEGFLKSLQEDFVLVDYGKFSRFIDNTALVRGRSFASLVGLSRYSAFRQMLEGAKDTRSLNSDLNIPTLQTEISATERQASDATRQAIGAYREITGQVATDLSDAAGLCTAVTAAVSGIELLKTAWGSADILTADLDAADRAVEAAEGGSLRQQHATLASKVAELEALAATSDEAADSAALQQLVVSRDEALAKIGSAVLRSLYEAARLVINEEGGSADPNRCPVCDTVVSFRLDEHVRLKLKDYSAADDLNHQLQQHVDLAAFLGRLGKLEACGHLEVAFADRKHSGILQSARQEALTLRLLDDGISALESLEAKRQALLGASRGDLKVIEAQLPPSLVAVTRVLDSARRFRDAMQSHGESAKALAQLRRRLGVRERWKTFIAQTADVFADAETALANQRIADIETEYQAFFSDLVRGGPDVQPTLERAATSEQIDLVLADFHGLRGISARAVLSESYRNAVAASIFLSAAVKHKGVPRFVILDDITSSFDAGHQFNLMEGIRTKLQQPHNPDGLQFIVLSHDTALEKYFDRLNGTTDWRHQKLQGMPPVGRVMVSAQEADRLKQQALQHLNAGQADIGAPLVRHYLEYKLGQIISRLEIPVPPDYATRGDRRTLSTYLDAIKDAVELYNAAGRCVLTPQQIADLTNTHAPAVIANFVSHYETNTGTPFNSYVLIGVLQNIDDLTDCFTYTDTAQTPPVKRYYRRLDRR